jgi:hypothetical protein
MTQILKAARDGSKYGSDVRLTAKLEPSDTKGMILLSEWILFRFL